MLDIVKALLWQGLFFTAALLRYLILHCLPPGTLWIGRMKIAQHPAEVAAVQQFIPVHLWDEIHGAVQPVAFGGRGQAFFMHQLRVEGCTARGR